MLTSVSVPVGTADDYARLGERARIAESLGFDAMFVTDHPAPTRIWLESGGHPTLDPFVTLSFIAAATTDLRVHTNLLVLAYRHPVIAAKSVASLDVLSGGRVLLGVGVGYMREEFEAVGAEFGGRGAAAGQALATMRTAWTGEPFGPSATVVAPVPIQRPHPPIWVGGNSTAAMRRAIEYGSGWSPMPSPWSAASVLGTPGIESIADLGGRIDRLHEMAEEAGRAQPLDIAVIPRTLSGFASREPESEEVLDEIAGLREVGATALVISLPDTGWDDRIHQLAKEVLNRI